MKQKLVDIITYITMTFMVIVIVLMWTDNFPMEYANLAIIFAAIILILRLGYRFYHLLKKRSEV